MLTVPCSLYCIWVSISADALELEWYTGKPRMYDETNLHCNDYKMRSLCSRFLVHFALFQ